MTPALFDGIAKGSIPAAQGMDQLDKVFQAATAAGQ